MIEAIFRFFDVLLNDLQRATGFDLDGGRLWFSNTRRRRLTYAAAMFLLSLVVLLIYACSQRPDV